MTLVFAMPTRPSSPMPKPTNLMQISTRSDSGNGPLGHEVILGSVNDPTWPNDDVRPRRYLCEVLKDVTFRVAPVSNPSGKKMITEINGAPILNCVRGEEPRDREALLDTIMKYSQMVFELADEISETDANPLLVTKK